MNLTKLPQEIIYRSKISIDDFDIDDESSADGILYNRIIELPLTVPNGWDKEKLVLTMFNDAYYLTTIIIIDERFSLHTHSWIDYYDIQWNDNLIVSTIFGMVDYYLYNTTGLPYHALSSVDDLLKDYKRKIASGSGAFISLEKITKPSQPLSCEQFQTEDICNTLLNYNTFKGYVKWGTIINNFEINDVIRIVRILGKNLKGQRFLLNNIFDDFDASEKRNNIELYELMKILKDTLNNEGELLTKRKLLEAQKMKQELSDEIFQQTYEQIENSIFEGHKHKYEQEISKLNEQVNLLSNEKGTLEKKIQILLEELDQKKREESSFSLEPDKAFNAQTGSPCLTNTQMGILMLAVGMMTEQPVPAKTTIGEVVENICGYKATSVNQNMKGAHREADKEAVAKAIESKFPNLAAKIRKL